MNKKCKKTRTWLHCILLRSPESTVSELSNIWQFTIIHLTVMWVWSMLDSWFCRMARDHTHSVHGITNLKFETTVLQTIRTALNITFIASLKLYTAAAVPSLSPRTNRCHARNHSALTAYTLSSLCPLLNSPFICKWTSPDKFIIKQGNFEKIVMPRPVTYLMEYVFSFFTLCHRIPSHVAKANGVAEQSDCSFRLPPQICMHSSEKQHFVTLWPLRLTSK